MQRLRSLLRRDEFVAQYRARLPALEHDCALVFNSLNILELEHVHDVWTQKYHEDLKNGLDLLSIHNWRDWLGYLCLLLATHDILSARPVGHPGNVAMVQYQDLIVRNPTQYLAIELSLEILIAVRSQLERIPVSHFLSSLTQAQLATAVQGITAKPSAARTFWTYFGV